jgi:hypothetical protein
VHAKQHFNPPFNNWKHLLKEQVVDQALPDIVPIAIPGSLSSEPIPSLPLTNSPISVPADRTNCAIRANCTTAKITINGISIEVDSSVSAEFLTTLIKAVRYA